jgi:hypothetical protein
MGMMVKEISSSGRVTLELTAHVLTLALQVLLVSRLAVLVFGIGAGLICMAFVAKGVNINW